MDNKEAYDDLFSANKELIAKLEEIEKRVGELDSANKQLILKIEEKEKRASDLLTANDKLIKAEKKIRKGNRLYAFISNTNKTIVHVKDEQTLFNDACEIAVKKGRFKMAWIGLADKTKKKIKLVASSADSEEDISIMSDYNYTTNGVIEKTLSGADYVLIPDLQNETETPWHKHANDLAAKSSICLPIKKSGETIGVFGLSASETDFFDPKGIDMLIEASNDISFALSIIEDDKQKKIVQQKLEYSEARLKEAQALGQIGNWEVDLITNTNLWSEQLYNIFGIDPKSVTPSTDSFLSLLHPDDFHQAKNIMSQDFKNHKSGSFNSRFLKEKYGIRHIYTEWKFEFDKNKKPIRIYGILQDITEAKRAESALRLSESHLYTIFESTSEGLILIDTNGIVKAFNSKIAEILLLNTEQEITIGSNFYGFIHASVKNDFKEDLSKVKKGETIKYDYYHKRENGDLKWFSVSVNPAYNKSGEIDGVCITINDITDRKETEKRLRDSESFSMGVLSSLSSQIAVLNADGTLVAVNKAWDDFAKENGPAHLSNVSVGSNYFEVCEKAIFSGEDDVKQTVNGIFSVFNKEKQSFQLEYPCDSPEEKRWFILNVSPFGEDDTKVVISHQNISERKIAENKLNDTSVELQKTLSELNKILDSSLDVICTIKANGEFVRISSASQSVWGYSPETLLGTKFMDLVYSEDVEKTSRAAEKIVSGIQIPIFENRYVHKSGKLIPMLWSVNWDEKLGLMYCVAKDVTNQKRLEKATQNERDQFNHMFSKAPSAIGLLIGPSHVFEMANPLYLQLTGKKNVIGKTVAEVFPEVVEQGFISMLDNVYLTGEPFIGEDMLIKIDTEENAELNDFYIDFIYQAYRNAEGTIEGVFFFINDVTEVVVSKQKIEKSEKQYRQIVETAQEGIWLIDENSKTIFVNKKMCDILGYTEEEMIGKTNSFFMDEAGREYAQIYLKRRKNGVAEKLELEYISKKGKRIITEVSANPIFDELGNFKGSLGMLSDVTEKKHLQDLLEKSNRLAAIGSWEIDVVKGTVFWSDITKEIREVDKDFVPQLGEGISYFKGTHKEIISQKVQDCIEHGTPWDEELQIITFKGNHKWIRTIGQGEFLNGICIRIHGSFQDIDERKKAEEAIRDSEEKRKLIMSGALDAIISIDPNGTITFWNPQAEVIFGWKEEEVMGQQLSELIVPERFRRYHKEGMTHYLKTGEGKVINALNELEAIRKSGEEFPIELTVIPIKQGGKLFFCAFVRDITQRKVAEIKIRESEFRYRQIVETAQEGIWMLDENEKTTFVNQKMCEILGYSVDEMIGKPNVFFKDAADLQTAINAIRRRRQGIIETYDASFLTKDGRLIWTQISSNPIFDTNKKYLGALGMVSDITEKLMADKMLLESEQKFRKLASELEIEQKRLVTAQAVAKVGSWETDLQTLQVNWSNETHRIFGSNPEKFEASHSAFLNFVHPEDREKVDVAFEASLHKSGSSMLEHRIITLKGKEKWVEEIWTVTSDETGSPMVAFGTCQDITKSKKEAEKVIRSEAKLNVAQYIANVGSYEVDMVTDEQSWSDEFYRILGISADVTPAREAFMSFVHPDDRLLVASTMDDAYSIYEDSIIHFRFIRKNGVTGYASSEWKFEFDANDQPLYLYGILRDLTKEKKAESERAKMISDIVQRNNDLEQFSYIVSHNLRAPTANIIGFAEILRDESYTPQEQKDSLQGLSASVMGLDTVIKDINTILESKRDDHEKKEIVIFSKLVKDIKLSISNLIEKHRVNIITDFAEVDEIYSLKIYIYSIFYNLISNSIKYGRPDEPPCIDIKSKKENGKIILIFKDNGLGIDMKTKADKIFGLYARFHSHVEGKGMGLFMVKTQVESLGGKISVASELNKGTEFTIAFKI